QVAIALGIRQLVRWPFLAIGSVVAALFIDVRLGLIFLVCMPIIGVVFALVMGRSVPYFQSMQTKLDRISLLTREALSGVRVVRAFGREDAQDSQFAEAAREQADTAIAVGKLSALLNPTTILVLNLGVVAILWQGGIQVNLGQLTQGEVMAFVNYMTQALVSIVYVANLVVVFTRGAASARRVNEVLNTQPSVRDGSSQDLPLDEPGQGGEGQAVPALALDHASFRYGGAARDALHDVTLRVPAGSTLGIIGGTGSGKSTLVSLVPRLYDTTSGSVRVFGHDVCEYPLSQLRRLVASVPQQASLVSGTIRTNLCWRKPDATDGELWQALEVAQAADFVRQKPQGLDEVVEAGGKNFSGGQRQRLTIARALVGSPRLLLLDDSASALDFATDAALRHAIRQLGSTLTTVIVSQRVSAVMGADQILVLSHGSVAGLGTHRQLLKDCQVYREICLSQLKKEEVLQ
ncbi:MAG: ABC transporter ATP-binding protein, partial [Coriobacteriales bacterium]|nr:ABC transporter ATP-binding protein [Coriobacteriales bacterium]